MTENVQTAKSALFAAYGPWALVTGASDGIGRAFAIEMARQGFSLVLVARRGAALDDLAEDVERRFGVKALPLVADLASFSQTARLDSETRDVDVGLIVLAAGYGGSGPFVDASQQAELGMIDLNCRALAQSAQDFSRRFVARGRGALVLMSSLVAFQGVPRAANYAATKAYVQTLAEGLAVELKDSGVDVLASAPGPVVSGFGARSGMKIVKGETPEEVARGTLRALGRRTTVRPGFLAKALEASLSPLPRYFRVRAMAKVMAGMTGA
jgi:short-subunit dehydrogenase